MEYNSGSNQASNFKSAEHVARGWFEIMNTITPELYDTKFYYQLIVPIIIITINKMQETFSVNSWKKAVKT